MMSRELIEEAREKAIELLHKLSTPQGFVASVTDIDNYKRIWARDGVIVGLSALTTGDEELQNTFLAHLRTLKQFQDKTGRIVSNVSLDGEKVSFGTTVGRVDATIWYVIGVARYMLERGDEEFWEEFNGSVGQALFYLECLELNGRGLLYVPAGGDWADEYILHGYVLFDECLYALALELVHQITGQEEIKDKYEHLRQLITVNFFPNKEREDSEFVYHQALYDHSLVRYQPPLPISSFSPFGTVHLHDLFATTLVLNLNLVPNGEELEQSYETACPPTDNCPLLPAFNPVIDEQHPLWEVLLRNHLFRFKNRPHEFHNGGLWPMVHGWYLASKTNLDEACVASFAATLQQDDYIFPEFYHGQHHTAMGTSHLGMSASGYLMAYHRLTTEKKPFNN